MYNKGTNYEILKTVFKVPQTLLLNLKTANVNFKAGDKSIRLESPALSKTLEFDNLLGSVIKSPKPEHIVKVNSFVSNYINELSAIGSAYIEQVDKVLVSKGDHSGSSNTVVDKIYNDIVNSVSDKVQELTKKSTIIKPAVVKGTVKPSSYINTSSSDFVKPLKDLNGLSPVKLKDAKYLYQKVTGTSDGSVYRVIALTNEFAIAARIHESTVSIRLESKGTLDKKIETKFKSLGLQIKNGYMSGHFTCTKCTPKRLIGAILVDSEIEFLTPIPTIADNIF